MDEATVALIDRIAEGGLAGTVPPKADVVRLLALDPCSPEASYLEERACEVAHRVSGDTGRIAGAVGIDFAPCSMNCSFCSFGERWGVIGEEVVYTEDEVIAMVRAYVEQGATMVTLRSTEFYDLDVLQEWIADIRAQVPGSYEINMNVGELTPERAQAIWECGATSAYHVLRLREGEDTPFDPEVRIATIRAIAASPLLLGTCVEPIGPEHTDDELADGILFGLECGAYSGGVMARVPVPGTPLEHAGTISEDRLMQILAVERIVAGSQYESIGCHPPVERALYAGANSLTVEAGANPRDVEPGAEPWKGFTVAEAKGLLEKAGFAVLLPNPEPRVCPTPRLRTGERTPKPSGRCC